ncbi:WGR domain-containing protein [Rhizobium deserti]|uniref:WGR domain-containing protein n=1 Tax=Rhizobium deserti TaxID=2547961 RepID=A0A4V3ANC5_9HYPH|nr:WGR domain-containing protein [Rhizobium deserti]TDK29809.1 WGR domain-containing protein [Rhizobium deserti]
MSTQQFQVHLVRVDRSRRMARFYHLSLEPSLFGDFAVARNWGRIGTHGRVRIDLFADEKAALQHFLGMMKQKKGRGYRPG